MVVVVVELVVVVLVVVVVVVVAIVVLVVVAAAVVVVVVVVLTVVVVLLGQIRSLWTATAPKLYLASCMVVDVRVQVLLLGLNCSTEFRRDEPVEPPKARISCCPSLVIVAIWK